MRAVNVIGRQLAPSLKGLSGVAPIRAKRVMQKSERMPEVIAFQSGPGQTLTNWQRARIKLSGWGVGKVNLPFGTNLAASLAGWALSKTNGFAAFRETTFNMVKAKKSELAGLIGGLKFRIAEMTQRHDLFVSLTEQCLNLENAAGNTAAAELAKRLAAQMRHLDQAKKVLAVYETQFRGYENMVAALPEIEARRAAAQVEVDAALNEVEWKETMGVDFTGEDPMALITDATRVIEEKKEAMLANLRSRAADAGKTLTSGQSAGQAAAVLPAGVSARVSNAGAVGLSSPTDIRALLAKAKAGRDQPYIEIKALLTNQEPSA